LRGGVEGEADGDALGVSIGEEGALVAIGEEGLRWSLRRGGRPLFFFTFWIPLGSIIEGAVGDIARIIVSTKVIIRLRRFD